MERLYGIATGDGNNGVGHTWPRYYVRTSNPWRLAEIAFYSDHFEEFRPQLAEIVEIDGDEEYCISASIFDYSDITIGEDDENNEYYNDYYQFILEVWPIDENESLTGAPVYDSIEECFSKAEIDFVAKLNQK